MEGIIKTRIIHTRFWEDSIVTDLTPNEKLLFFYYFTNHRIGLTGIYEINDRTTLFETGLTKEELNQAKENLVKETRILIKDKWLLVVNAQRLGGYYGEKLDPAVQKELSRIPNHIIDYFNSYDTVCIPYTYYRHTTITNKEEYINNKIDSTDTIVLRDIEDLL